MIRNITHMDVVADQLAIQFDQNEEIFLPLAFLRRACPCAACQGEPDALGRVIRPQKDWTERSFALTKIDNIGSYALQLYWLDGHNTGIYSFDYLVSLQNKYLTEIT